MAMQLHFKSFGSGDPLIILHGMLGMLDNWQSFGKEMSHRHLVYLMDLRNHGRSKHRPTLSYREMADDLRETMEHQWMYDGAIIIGHSMGGKTAMQLALDHPEFVNILVVLDIAPVRYTGGHEQILGALNHINLSEVKSREDVSDQLSKEISDQAIINFLMKNLGRSKDGSYLWKMNLKAITREYPNLLMAPEYSGEPFYGPTLFVRGSRSNYIATEHHTLINEWFPNAQIVTIENAGHWVHVDQPEKLKNVLQDFIMDHSKV